MLLLMDQSQWDGVISVYDGDIFRDHDLASLLARGGGMCFSVKCE